MSRQIFGDFGTVVTWGSTVDKARGLNVPENVEAIVRFVSILAKRKRMAGLRSRSDTCPTKKVNQEPPASDIDPFPMVR